jgi:hypothetical protein
MRLRKGRGTEFEGAIKHRSNYEEERNAHIHKQPYGGNPAVATLHGSTGAEVEALVLEEPRTQNLQIVHGNRRSEPRRAILLSGAAQPTAPVR